MTKEEYRRLQKFFPAGSIILNKREQLREKTKTIYQLLKWEIQNKEKGMVVLDCTKYQTKFIPISNENHFKRMYVKEDLGWYIPK